MSRRIVAAVVASGLMAWFPVLGDIPSPTVVTVHFEKGGQPYNEPVKFTVRCFGWAVYPGNPGFPPGKKPEPYVPKEIYSFSGNCPGYGCEITHEFYLNYKHIDFCNLEGRTQGRSFAVEKYSDQPVSRCEEPSSRLLGKRRCELNVALPK